MDKRGLISVPQLEKCLYDNPDTFLVSIMHANHETGTLQPVAKIGELIKNRNAGLLGEAALRKVADARSGAFDWRTVQRNAPRCRAALVKRFLPGIQQRKTFTHCYFHVDASQSISKVAVDVGKMGADFLTIAGHKMGAPKGVGALYIAAKGGFLRPYVQKMLEKAYEEARKVAASEREAAREEAAEARMARKLAKQEARVREPAPGAGTTEHGPSANAALPSEKVMFVQLSPPILRPASGDDNRRRTVSGLVGRTMQGRVSWGGRCRVGSRGVVSGLVGVVSVVVSGLVVLVSRLGGSLVVVSGLVSVVVSVVVSGLVSVVVSVVVSGGEDDAAAR